jgi:putative ABC transport system permease protein
VSALLNDLRFALRLVRAAPGFTVIAALTLALGIGVNAAMFSFVDGVLLKPLPYPHGEELIEGFEKSPSGERGPVSTLNFQDWRSQTAVFAAMAAQANASVTLAGGDLPVLLQAGRVTWPFLEIFGVKLALGRSFLPEEDQPGKDRVVILSHRLWESRFGSDHALIGRALILDDKPYTVVGVLSPGGPYDKGYQDLWMPLAFGPKDQARGFRWLKVWARLKPGVSLKQAEAQMDSVAGRIQLDHPDSNKGWGIRLVRLVDDLTPQTLRRSLLVLLGAVAGVLLIACANLANLLLVRGGAREREVAIRAAMGASRRRLVSQFLIESVVLAGVGGLLGVWIAYGFIAALKAWIPPLILPPEVEVHLDGRVLLFTAAIVFLTGILFGIGPALSAVRGDLARSLKEFGRRATAGAAQRRLRDAFVVLQVALAFILLSGAGLLIRSLSALEKLDPGFEVSNLLTMGLPMQSERYPDGVRIVGYLTRVRENIAAIPGVLDVATTSALPMMGWGWSMPFQIEGRPVSDPAARPDCFFKIVSPTYFRTLGMRLREGRVLAETDTAGSPRVAVINTTMALQYFRGEDPVGKRAVLPLVSGNQRGADVPWEIVGIVADETVKSLRDASPGVYVSYRQSPALSPSLVVRSAIDPSYLSTSIENAVRQVNPTQPLADIRTLEELRSLSFGSRRLRTFLLSLFAGLALLLAALGIYGVLSYVVSQRTQEIGIRAAMGAMPRDQLRLVMGNGLFLATVGIAAGVLGSLALTQVLTSLLFGVTPHDPWTLAAVGVILLAVAVIACYAPARRALRVDPVVALRHE